MIEKKQKIVSYVESSLDQASSSPVLDIGFEKEYLSQVRSPDGQRSFPGQALARHEASDQSQVGFLWADTPESSVFIRKKQWRDDGWNYTIDVNPEKASEQEIKEKITSGEKLNRKIRNVLGKIITRKLEWLNDHEQFTKSAAALRSMISLGEEPIVIQPLYDVGTSGEPEKTGVNFKTLDEIVEDIGKMRNEGKVAKPEETKKIKATIVEKNQDTLRQVSRNQGLNDSELIKGIVSGSLPIPNGTRLYYDTVGDSLFHSNGTLSKEADDLLLNLYAPTQVSDGSFTRYFLVKEKMPDETTNIRFNGVIEFANITSISTAMSLSANGSATLNFENPGNIMMISRDDIELALAEVEIPDIENGTLINNLVFYRGRYYTKTAYDTILSREYTDVYDTVVKQKSQAKKVVLKETIPDIISGPYKVVKGDTINGLAEKFKTTPDEIIALNSFIKDRVYKNKDGKILLRGQDYIIEGEFLNIPNKEFPSTDPTATNQQDKTTAPNNEQDAPNPDQDAPKDEPGPLSSVGDPDANPPQFSEKEIARDKLRKFALNRYIVEPVDHVWIWLTSPSKSLFVLDSTRLDNKGNVISSIQTEVVEAPDSIMALKLQENELTIQLNNLEEEGTQLEVEAKSSQVTPERKEEIQQRLKAIEAEMNSISNNIATINGQITSIQVTKNLGKTSTDSATANRTQLLDDITKDSDLYNVVRETQGLSEQQFQVFEGVVTDVQESYSDGKYTLSATCTDIFYFLEISRIIEKPSLSGTSEPKFELNNPIVTVGEGTEKVGAWKSGMFCRYAEMCFADTEKNANVNKDQGAADDGSVKKEATKTLVASDAQQQIGIFVTDKPFAKTDAANVISLLILGIPYNPDLFIQSALVDGRLQLEEKKEQEQNAKPKGKSETKTGKKETKNKDQSTIEAAQDLSKNGYFQVIKRMIGVQNSFLGNFKPFVPLTADKLTQSRAENLKILQSDIKTIEAKAKEILKAKPLKELPPPKENEKSSDVPTVDLTVIGGSDKTKIDGREFSDALITFFVSETKSPTDVGRIALPSIEEWTVFVKKASGLKKDEKNSTTVVPERSPQGDQILSELYSKRVNLQALQKVPTIVDSFLKGATEAEDTSDLGALMQSRIKRREDIVRNSDDNYLVISDEYTFNNDIAAFNYMIGDSNWSLFQSSFETPLNTCKRAAEVVNFEFFADENGNIRFEPPRYNRILREHLPRLFGQGGPIGQELRLRFKSNKFTQFMKDLDSYKKLTETIQKLESDLASSQANQRQLDQLLDQEQKVADKIKVTQQKIDNLDYFYKVTINTNDSAGKFLENRDMWVNHL